MLVLTIGLYYCLVTLVKLQNCHLNGSDIPLDSRQPVVNAFVKLNLRLLLKCELLKNCDLVMSGLMNNYFLKGHVRRQVDGSQLRSAGFES